MDLEELYHKYRIRLKQSLFTTFATIGLIVCTVTLAMLIWFHNVSIKVKVNNHVNIKHFQQCRLGIKPEDLFINTLYGI